MFCSKCGKTIRPDDQLCPSCHAPIGDNRFGGIPYTSAQFSIAPGQTVFEPLKDYTRTTYSSLNEDSRDSGEVDTRTTYRPVYEGASAPEDVRRDMRAAVAEQAEAEAEQAEARPAPVPGKEIPEPIAQAAQETLNEVDNELKMDDKIDMSQFRSRPIQSAGRAGISRDVSEYIQKIEDGQTRKGGRHRRAARPEVYDDYDAQDAYDDTGAPLEPDDESGEVYDEIDDADFDYERRMSRFSPRQIIKIVAALVIVAVLVGGGAIWLRYIRSNQSSAPIEGVTESFYNSGIALIKTHVESAYIDSLLSKYSTDGILSMAAQLETDDAEINALLPAEPAANDQTFLDALQAIQDNIGNAVTMDALSVGNATATSLAESESRWQIVNNSITQLEGVTSAAELTNIINGQSITVITETPAPTTAPTAVSYPSLQKGDKSDAVMQLQLRLFELGYLNDNRDGNFGSKTQTAVKLFQETAGLNASGIADNETQTLLYSADAPYAPGATTPAPTAEPTPEAIQPAEAAAAEQPTATDETLAA